MAVAKLYAHHCHCQPLPLFRIEQVRENAETFSWEVIYAILAVASRFSDDASLQDDYICQPPEYADKALLLVMRKVTEGRVELSTLQALCLLAFVDLTGMSKITPVIYG